jgi:uncharacterized protein YgiM (DUF1202 family)
MKTSFCFLFSAFLATSMLAQPTNSPPPAPGAPAVTNASASATATNVPPAPSGKKKAPKKAAKKPVIAELRTVPLVAGPAAVIASNVNVRGQAKLKSEVVGKLTKGQAVTVLDEITLKNSAPDEPSAWAKIVLPPSIHVWVNTTFINATNKTVIPRKLNLRGGPGENYSVLGTMKRGDTVKEISNKGDWLEIEPPVDAYAFVAAQYLSQETPVLAALPSEPTGTNTVTDPAVATAVTDVPATNATEVAAATTTTNAPTPPTEPTEPTAAPDEPPPKRVVQREGIVRGTISIQAPTHFELASPENGRTINYLYTTSASLDLRRYKGFRIIVTGEEGLDERWRNTPVITIQKIHVLE